MNSEWWDETAEMDDWTGMEGGEQWDGWGTIDVVSFNVQSLKRRHRRELIENQLHWAAVIGMQGTRISDYGQDEGEAFKAEHTDGRLYISSAYQARSKPEKETSMQG